MIASPLYSDANNQFCVGWRARLLTLVWRILWVLRTASGYLLLALLRGREGGGVPLWDADGGWGGGG